MRKGTDPSVTIITNTRLRLSSPVFGKKHGAQSVYSLRAPYCPAIRSIGAMSSIGIHNGSAPPRDSGDLRSIAVFRKLPDADLDRIFPTLHASSVRRGRTLNMCDQRACFVWSG